MSAAISAALFVGELKHPRLAEEFLLFTFLTAYVLLVVVALGCLGAFAVFFVDFDDGVKEAILGANELKLCSFKLVD